MPPSTLSGLHSSEVLQLAVQLSDARVGLPASGIRWLLGWAEGLSGADIKVFDRDQLFDLIQLLAAATAAPSASGSNTASSAGGSLVQQRLPSSQLLGLLCWAVTEHVSTASALQVYCLIKALSGWRYVPPNGDILLSAVAARVADKLPVLHQLQLSDVLCGFARLGFSVGEPLQTKLCSRLLQAVAAGGPVTGGPSRAAVAASGGSRSAVAANAAAQQQLEGTAAVLASVLVSISNPPAELVPSLMQQLDGRLAKLPAELLLQLGSGFLAAGMLVEGSSSSTAGAASAGGRKDTSASTTPGIPPQWGQQYLAAVGNRVYALSLSQLAAAADTLQQLGLPADEATAAAVVQALERHLAAATAAGSGMSVALLAPVVSYVTESGFRPAGQGMAAVEQQLLSALRASNASRSGGAGGAAELVLQAVASRSSDASASSAVTSTATTAAAVYEVRQEQAQEQQQEQTPGPQALQPATFVKLLKALHDWGRRPGSDFAAAAYDWSRHQLVECDVSTLGPLLLWLSCLCGKPPQAWMADWTALTQQQMQAASPADLPILAVALAQSCAAAAAGNAASGGGNSSGSGSTWWQGFSTAVLQHGAAMSDQDLEVLCSSLYKLGYRPSPAWLGAVQEQLQGRVPAGDSGVNTAAGRALAWLRQLKVA